MTFWLSNRLVKQLSVLTRPTQRLLHPPAMSLPRQPLCFDLSTPLEGCFNSRQVVTC